MTICILGAGAFGSALAVTLAKNSKTVMLWSRTQKHAATLQKTRENRKYLLNLKFTPNIKITSNFDFAVKNVSTILLCIPAQKLYTFLATYHLRLPNVPLILCSKGIDEKRLLLQSQVVKKFLTQNKVAVLTGPSFASELAVGLPTALTLACKDEIIRNNLQRALTTSNLRLYASSDIIGAQVGGSLKNVIAIGCGMVGAAKLGESARAALMSRGLSEMIDLGIALGADVNTFYGLSGIGDLALTSTSLKSRNFVLGLTYGEIFDKNRNKTIEGIKTASAANKLAKKMGIEAPIIETIDLILKRKISLDSSIKNLLSRPLKNEFL